MKRNGKLAALSAGIFVAVLLGACWPQFVAWYRFYSLFESLGKNEQGYLEYGHRQTGLVMVKVPGGTFLMGSPKDEENRRVDEQQHEVHLSPFLIGKYEVTEGQWKTIAGALPGTRTTPLGDTMPVQESSWEDWRSFCKETGLEFPTEAQWEYACRAGTQSPYGGTGILEEMGWYEKNSGNSVRQGGQKKPNGFGLYDMHGNVNEWCRDYYDESFYTASGGRPKDPLCTVGSLPVLRGGSVNSEPRWCRSAHRQGEGESRYTDLGFRPAYYPLP